MLLALGACSDDDNTPTADQGQALDQGGILDQGKPAEASVPLELGAADKGAQDKGSAADSSAALDKAAVADAPSGKPFFTLGGDNYPVTPTAVFCTVVQKMYNIRTGAKRGGTGPQANAYAYFAAPGPPAAGTYKTLGYGLTPPGPGETRLMVAELSKVKFWWSKAGGQATVTVNGGKATVSWSGQTLVDQNDSTKTATSSALMTCK